MSVHMITLVSNPLPNSFKVKTLHVSGQMSTTLLKDRRQIAQSRMSYSVVLSESKEHRV